MRLRKSLDITSGHFSLFYNMRIRVVKPKISQMIIRLHKLLHAHPFPTSTIHLESVESTPQPQSISVGEHELSQLIVLFSAQLAEGWGTHVLYFPSLTVRPYMCLRSLFLSSILVFWFILSVANSLKRDGGCVCAFHKQISHVVNQLFWTNWAKSTTALVFIVASFQQGERIKINGR